jgi:predicted ATPase
MIPPAGLHSMSSFDPLQPAILHDSLNDEIVTWTGEHGDDFAKHARKHSEGVMEYDGRLFDGWGNVLGG